MAPPGLAALGSPRWFDRSERAESISHAPVSDLVAAAAQHPDLAHIPARRLERDLVSWLIVHADPTGEQAVRNVINERGF